MQINRYLKGWLLIQYRLDTGPHFIICADLRVRIIQRSVMQYRHAVFLLQNFFQVFSDLPHAASIRISLTSMRMEDQDLRSVNSKIRCQLLLHESFRV